MQFYVLENFNHFKSVFFPPDKGAEVKRGEGWTSFSQIPTFDIPSHMLCYVKSGVISLFLAYWATFRKVFLHGYIWFGFCGAAGIIGACNYGIIDIV